MIPIAQVIDADQHLLVLWQLRSGLLWLQRLAATVVYHLLLTR